MAHFSKGADVEVSTEDEGFRGAWYEATVVRPVSKKNKIIIEYSSLVANESSSKPLRETIDAIHIRPRPPREINRTFKLSEEVDAFHNDGWWEGVVTEVLENSRYSVFFRVSKEQIEFSQSELRLHREWMDGTWVPPVEEQLESQSESSMAELKSNKRTLKIKQTSEVRFSNGTLVEVSSDEEGFQGAWFTAIIIEAIANDKFLVEYQTLETEDGTKLLREEADSQHIRPSPPEIHVDSFHLLEEVDALYNDGWWVGVISKVLSASTYIVYFRNSKEELEFGHSQLRIHQDWIDGKWVRASQALKL